MTCDEHEIGRGLVSCRLVAGYQYLCSLCGRSLTSLERVRSPAEHTATLRAIVERVRIDWARSSSSALVGSS